MSSPHTDNTSRTNRHFQSAAQEYNRMLNRPLVRRFRHAEQQAVYGLFTALIQPEDVVLEIGCGTGYYTRDLLQRARHVIALDASEAMLMQLRMGLSPQVVAKAEFVCSDALHYHPLKPLDWVVHIGVMDYIREWEAFLAHSLACAHKGVLFTCPAKSLWGHLYRLGTMRRSYAIQRYHRNQIEHFVQTQCPGCCVEMHCVGLNSGWSGALTWVGSITRRHFR